MKCLPEKLSCSLEHSRNELQKSIEQTNLPDRSKYFFAVEDSFTHGYTIMSTTPLGKLVEAEYFIRKKFWGKGYTAEAFAEVIRFAFQSNQVYHLSCGCLVENSASEKIMKMWTYQRSAFEGISITRPRA